MAKMEHLLPLPTISSLPSPSIPTPMIKFVCQQNQLKNALEEKLMLLALVLQLQTWVSLFFSSAAIALSAEN